MRMVLPERPKKPTWVTSQLRTMVTVVLKNRDIQMRLTFDTAGEINLISRRLACDLGLEKAPKAEKLDNLILPGGQTATAREPYALRWRAKDATGRTSEQTTYFYSIDDGTTGILLGMPGLKDRGIVLDPRANSWRYPFESTDLDLQGVDEFAEQTNQEAGDVYALSIKMTDEGQKTYGVRVASYTLSPFTPEKARQIIQKYDALFKLPEEPKPVAGTEHAIETIADPPFGPIYSLSARELDALRDYLAIALKRGWISHSESPAGSPILFVPKKDGGLRLCVDYRALNKVTVKNRMALPLIGEILDRISGSTVFSKIDLEAAYYRIPVRKSDRWKTAFRTRYGHFEYNVMAFGLTNAPATFQAYINKTLAGLVDTTCIVYLDDILIFSKDAEEHTRHVEEVLARLLRYGLYINPAKCEFFSSKVNYLGFVLTPDGVEMDPTRVEAIREWPEPQNFKDLQIFLGFANYYRRFIEGFSHIARPLSDMLKGSKNGKIFGSWTWGEKQVHAFRWLRDAFTRAPVLAHFHPERRLAIETDASSFAASAILTQLGDDNHWHPVAYWSRKLIPAETRYDTHDRELLAIVEAFKHWRHYLDGSSHATMVITDHENLKAFATSTKLSPRQCRWVEHLQGFDFQVLYRPGHKNPADAPSRRPDYAPSGEEKLEASKSLLPTLQHKLSLLRTDLGDPRIQAWIQSEDQASRLSYPSVSRDRTSTLADARYGVDLDEDLDAPEVDAHAESTVDAGSSATVQCVPLRVARIAALQIDPVHGEEDGARTMLNLILELQRTDPFTEAKRKELAGGYQGGPWSVGGRDEIVCYKGKIFVPDDIALRKALLQRFHDSPLAGHFGRDRTKELIQRHYHWMGIDRHVEEYVKSCPECQFSHAKRHRPYGELVSLEPPSGPWEDLSMDFITDLPSSKKGDSVYNAILVIVDRFTKMALYIPTVKTVTSEILAELYMEHVVSKYGVPKSVVSDRGSQFTSLLWEEFALALKMRRRLSTAYHPQTDGQTERQNQTLEAYLRIFCNDNQDDWARILPQAEFAYNNSVHSVTQATPFELNGRSPRVTWEDYEEESLRTRLGRRKVLGLQESLTKLRDNYKLLRERLGDAAVTQAMYYNKHREPKVFEPEQKVMISTKHLTLKQSKKSLAPKYLGPLEVIEPVGRNAYRLRIPEGWRIHDVVNISQIEDFKARNDNGEPLASSWCPDHVALEQEWGVEAIVDSQYDPETGGIKYLVRWTGDWPVNQKETWEPASNMRGASDLVRKWEKQYPTKKPQTALRTNLSQKAGVRRSTRSRVTKR
jgi:RNase H-like domain found in reverse transcriptase/Reverse transcriptase (RNA-dependent DNA polymerase)/Integrase zinc binding domain/Chromo (CHRromatin Organisation MOdifier) domain